MTIWDNPELQSSKYDQNSPFLGKCIAPGESMTLTFHEIMSKVRGEDTKVGQAGDKYFEFFFIDETGKERTIQQNTGKGAFIRVMREADVQPGEMISVTRSGEGTDTTWEIAKVLIKDGEKVVKENKQVPF